ncbi:glycosyl hydrolase family protein [bacterium]|nr:MAG: glycosyl hydrolase family protein [bacterium]
MKWAASEVDATQPAVIDGGGLRTFTITRDGAGKWSFNSDEWKGGPVTFTDNTTTTFTQVVLCGSPNTDDLLYGKIKLESDKAPDPTLIGANGTIAQTPEYLDFNPGRVTAGSEWVQKIEVKSPALRSEVKGDVKVEFSAPGMTQAVALCWQQPTKAEPSVWGHDAKLADIKLDATGNGSFVFPAEQFPNGPITVRILASNDNTKDSREIQLYNTGGVVWNQGMPKTAPAAAQGMKLAFADDFNGPLSISRDGKNARYNAHKPGGGDFSGWPFSDPEGPDNPYSQQGTYLRIRASKKPDGKGSAGIIAPIDADGKGFYATAPFYMECRFTAQSAPGTWPAFWTLIREEKLGGEKGLKDVNDELDIIEAYGGVGPGNPNHPGYSITSHFWNQKDAEGKKVEDKWKRIDMLGIGGKSYWSTTFHTYAVKVTLTDTIYYLDDIEVFRHPSGELSKTQPSFFMINYAIGGISGWKIDLEREGNASDMYVDYVRVYQGTK